MDFDIERINKAYYLELDKKAMVLATGLTNKKNITLEILKSIKTIYDSKKVEYTFHTDPQFELAYHPPATSDIEFLIARIIYHYSETNSLGWHIKLRKQKKSTSPDIRIESDGKTLAIIEIKAKAGWIQPLFSRENFKKRGESQADKDQIRKIRETFEKYCRVYNITSNKIFLLIPTLKEVHRKKSSYSLDDYRTDFSFHSGIPKTNLILLSEDLTLNLDSETIDENKYKPTTAFEQFINKL